MFTCFFPCFVGVFSKLGSESLDARAKNRPVEEVVESSFKYLTALVTLWTNGEEGEGEPEEGAAVIAPATPEVAADQE